MRNRLKIPVHRLEAPVRRVFPVVMIVAFGAIPTGFLFGYTDLPPEIDIDGNIIPPKLKSTA